MAWRWNRLAAARYGLGAIHRGSFWRGTLHQQEHVLSRGTPPSVQDFGFVGVLDVSLQELCGDLSLIHRVDELGGAVVINRRAQGPTAP